MNEKTKQKQLSSKHYNRKKQQKTDVKKEEETTTERNITSESSVSTSCVNCMKEKIQSIVIIVSLKLN